MAKVLWNRVLRRLSSLPLAIGELALIAVLSAVGTIIEQNKPLEYYMKVWRAHASCFSRSTLRQGLHPNKSVPCNLPLLACTCWTMAPRRRDV